MLGLFLIYFIWKRYSELAIEHNKSKWGYGLLGIACYYGGTLLVGFMIGLISVFSGSNYFLEETNDFVLGLIAFPFGLLSVWGVYKILQNKWSKAPMDAENDTLDGDLIQSSTKEL